MVGYLLVFMLFFALFPPLSLPSAYALSPLPLPLAKLLPLPLPLPLPHPLPLPLLLPVPLPLPLPLRRHLPISPPGRPPHSVP